MRMTPPRLGVCAWAAGIASSEQEGQQQRGDGDATGHESSSVRPRRVAHYEDSRRRLQGTLGSWSNAYLFGDILWTLHAQTYDAGTVQARVDQVVQ